MPMIELLVKNGARVDQVTPDGSTALHLSASTGNRAVAEALIQLGAEIDVVNTRGVSPLLFAVQGGHDEVAELLIAHGADVNVQTKLGYTSLCIVEDVDLAARLIDHGARVDHEMDSGTMDSPLHLASFWGRRAIVELLVSLGADIDRVNGQGETPLDLAEIGDEPTIVSYLSSLGARRTLAPAEVERRKELVVDATSMLGRKGRPVMESRRIVDPVGEETRLRFVVGYE